MTPHTWPQLDHIAIKHVLLSREANETPAMPTGPLFNHGFFAITALIANKK